MKKNFPGLLLVLAAMTLLSACNSGSDSSNGGKNNPVGKPTNRIPWPPSAEFNPSTEDFTFQTGGFEKLNVDAFGFDDYVELIYSNDIPANTGFVRLFKVWKKQASWGRLEKQANGKTLKLSSFGTYQCSIRKKNGQITDLEGGCYVRMQIVVPTGSQIEVYNLGQLISNRFIPVDNDTFFKDLDRASRSEDKFAAIENYLTSYQVTSKTPSMSSYELGEVIAKFSWKEEKFKALNRLHPIVSDRQNLAAMIESKFSYFDRDEARRIVRL